MLNMPDGLFALSRSRNRDKPLSLQDIAAFRRDGHILLRGVATREEIARFRPVICAAAYKYSSETRNLSERDTYGRAFLQIMNLWRRDERVKEFVLARKFARIAADLLGVERVRLYHDQALFKEPNGGHTPWHQDQYYWPLDTDKTITMWMPLVDVGAEMGLMRFASGSHRAGPIGSIQISDESAEVYEKYIAANGLPVVQASRMNAGDATFHTGWTIHGAGANISPDKTREVMTVIYFADGARITQPQNEHQAADLAAWLDSKEPGELAGSYLNPICTTGAQASRLQ